MKLKDILNESVNQPINEKADPKNFIKGFVAGDVIVNDDNSRYVIVAQRGKQFIVGDNGERRESLPGGKVGKKNLKGNLSLKDILNESVNEAYDFKPNKNMNNLMKGRKIKNVVYSDKLGFAIILDNGKFVLIRGHRATPGSEKELELESVNEGASTEEKRIVMMAVRKIAKYRNVPIDQSVVDVMRAAQELERDIQKGKVK
jgi:phosphopantetheine adenylyltransferase